METIFHEKQEGSLCAQHCLNALLQGQYFTAIDLADIARQLDETEREQMAEGGTTSESYKQFMEEPSSNYDDSGFFSVQVISHALQVWGLELVPYSSQYTEATAARTDPTTQNAYICNFKEHWLTIRKLGDQWFNLNSLLTGPELLSDTLLQMFLVQLKQEGYAIFVVKGELPDCEADQMLRLVPAVQPIKPHLISDQDKGSGQGQGQVTRDDLQMALETSRQMMEDEQIKIAMQMSMEISDGSTSQASQSSTSEELRQRRLAHFSQQNLGAETESSVPSGSSEDEELQAAIRMSLAK